jgi:hypothetical protein
MFDDINELLKNVDSWRKLLTESFILRTFLWEEVIYLMALSAAKRRHA